MGAYPPGATHSTHGSRLPRAHDGIRTRDLFLTKEVLYRLSYVSNRAVRRRADGDTP